MEKEQLKVGTLATSTEARTLLMLMCELFVENLFQRARYFLALLWAADLAAVSRSAVPSQLVVNLLCRIFISQKQQKNSKHVRPSSCYSNPYCYPSCA